MKPFAHPTRLFRVHSIYGFKLKKRIYYLTCHIFESKVTMEPFASKLINIINNHLGGNEGEAFLHPSYNNILRCAPEQEEILREIFEKYKIEIHAIPTNNYTDSNLLLEARLDQNGKKSKNGGIFSVNTYKLYLVSMLAAWEGFLVCHKASNDTIMFEQLLELADSLGKQDNQELSEDASGIFNYYDSFEIANKILSNRHHRKKIF